MNRAQFDSQLIAITPALLSWCKILCKNDYNNTWDVVQCTNLIALENYRKCKPQYFKTWIFAIARNRAAHFRREIGKSADLTAEIITILENTPECAKTENTAPDMLHRWNLRRKLRYLPDIKFRIIYLYIKGYTYKQISHRLNINPGYVTTQIRYLKKTILSKTGTK